MARIRWHGAILNATFIKQLAGGDWVMQAEDDGVRLVKGTLIRVMPSEFIDPPPTVGSVQNVPNLGTIGAITPEMVAAWDQLPTDGPTLGTPPSAPTGSMPDVPTLGAILKAALDDATQAINDAQTKIKTEEQNAMSLADKMAAAAAAVADITKELEAQADDVIARKAAISERGKNVFNQHQAILDQAGKGLDAVEGALRLLSNGGPPLEAPKA